MFAFPIGRQNPIKTRPIYEKHESAQNAEQVSGVVGTGSFSRERMVVVPFSVH